MAVEATAYHYERRPVWSWVWETIDPLTHCERPMELVSYNTGLFGRPGWGLKFKCSSCGLEEWTYTLEMPEFVEHASGG